MKKNTILKISAITLPLMALTIFTTSSVFAADAATEAKTPIVLTDAQKIAVGQAYELRMNGKFDEAKQAMETANVPKPQRMAGRGMMRGDFGKNQEEVKTAILNNDFAKYKELTKDRPNADKIDEAAFAKLVQAHKLMEEGKMDEAQTILKDLGMGPGLGQGIKPGMRPGFGRGKHIQADTADQSQ
ncbi:MAG: hypothetical protein ABIB04_02795 [Patescibacteria group bacterium]